jgi:hypothetical protein
MNEFAARGPDFVVTIDAASPLSAAKEALPRAVAAGDDVQVPLRVLMQVFGGCFCPADDLMEQPHGTCYVKLERYERLCKALADDGFDFAVPESTLELAEALMLKCVAWGVKDERRSLAIADIEDAEPYEAANGLAVKWPGEITFGQLAPNGNLAPLAAIAGHVPCVLKAQRTAATGALRSTFEYIALKARSVFPELEGVNEMTVDEKVMAVTMALEAIAIHPAKGTVGACSVQVGDRGASDVCDGHGDGKGGVHHTAHAVAAGSLSWHRCIRGRGRRPGRHLRHAQGLG